MEKKQETVSKLVNVQSDPYRFVVQIRHGKYGRYAPRTIGAHGTYFTAIFENGMNEPVPKKVADRLKLHEGKQFKITKQDGVTTFKLLLE